MEGNKEIFKAIIEPFIVDPISEAVKKKQLQATSTANDVELEELPDLVIQPLDRYCK